MTRQRDIRDRTAADVVPEQQAWLDDGRIPLKSVTVIVGPKGVGKTALGVWIASQVTTGAWGARGKVFLSATEDDVATTIRPRLEAAGADLSLVLLPEEAEPPLKFPRDLDRLIRYINARRPRLVLLDSLEAHIPVFYAAGVGRSRARGAASRRWPLRLRGSADAPLCKDRRAFG